MDHKKMLKAGILLCSISYQIWGTLTFLVVLLYECEFFGFNAPSFILAYGESIIGFMDNPKTVPFAVLFPFVLGGVCMGIAVINNTRAYVDNFFKSFEKGRSTRS